MEQCKHCGKFTHEPLRIAGNWWCRVSHYRAFYNLNHTIHFGSTVKVNWPTNFEEDTT